jgi:hypothetical protein
MSIKAFMSLSMAMKSFLVPPGIASSQAASWPFSKDRFLISSFTLFRYVDRRPYK